MDQGVDATQWRSGLVQTHALSTQFVSDPCALTERPSSVPLKHNTFVIQVDRSTFALCSGGWNRQIVSTPRGVGLRLTVASDGWYNEELDLVGQ
ncbi:hypothetical protein M514_10220 [Trichuris suis]|uniref:Uncharacterized protein n=1 Tax=Trichuris suis TaxID=68888 RepID=A0A085LV61_9BILA|nr:hypothetical protein M513_10220 [Trichuris suis]KFD66244.1 hypothetical protein M514_10220 [Trichuris suis]